LRRILIRWIKADAAIDRVKGNRDSQAGKLHHFTRAICVIGAFLAVIFLDTGLACIYQNIFLD
jgi:hypothetical protein